MPEPPMFTSRPLKSILKLLSFALKLCYQAMKLTQHQGDRSSGSKTPKGTCKRADPKGALFLKKNHVAFEAPSQKESVFFDECNHEIVNLTTGIESKTRVIFQSTKRPEKIQFLLPVDKKILSIKLNSTRSVLAYHVEKSNLELIDVNESVDADGHVAYALDDKRYIQPSRARNSRLIGFLWTSPSEIVMITDLSVEFYHVDSRRRRLRNIKLFPSSTNWFVYQPNCPDHSHGSNQSVLMVSTGSLGNSMQPYLFSRGQIFKLQRFEVEGHWHDSDKLELFERSITIANLYGQVRLLILQHESLNVKSRGAQILLYTVDLRTGLTSRTHTLDLDVSGKFAINILDNLIVAHDQPSKTSFIFDIMIDSTEKSDCPKHFVSLIDSQPIRPPDSAGSKAIEMYSLNWVFFQPNFIIDAKLGVLSTLHLDLNFIQDVISDDLVLLNFLAHRTDSKPMILEKCKRIVSESFASALKSNFNFSPLANVSAAFEIISQLVITNFESEVSPDAIEEVSIPATNVSSHFQVTLDQKSFHEEVLKQLDLVPSEQESAHLHFATSALFEFIFLVRKRGKNVDRCIYEQLTKQLIRGKRYFQIAQMIRSDIIEDPKIISLCMSA